MKSQRTLRTKAGRYAEALETHRRIARIYPRVAAAKVVFHAPQKVGPTIPLPTPDRAPFVDTDRIVCALAIKAATTKRAVLKLCASGEGAAALALTRGLIENAVLLEWLIRGEKRQRLETYQLFLSVLREKGIEKIEHFYRRFAGRRQPHARSKNPYDLAIAQHVFQGKHDTWAYFPNPKKRGELQRIPIRTMFEDVTGHKRPVDRRGAVTRGRL